MRAIVRPMSRKRLSREQQIERDAERLDDAADELIAQVGIVVDGADMDPGKLAFQTKLRLDAIKALPLVLERKSKLLGLDAPEQKKSDAEAQTGTLAELERKLALVGPDRAS